MRLEAIVGQLEREAAALGPFDGRVVHGDFLLKQLLVAGDRLAVFDFDDVGIPLNPLATEPIGSAPTLRSPRP